MEEILASIVFLGLLGLFIVTVFVAVIAITFVLPILIIWFMVEECLK